MKIYVNARFLTQPLSGVQRYAIECSRQIKKICPDAVFLTPVNILHNNIATELGAKTIGTKTGHIWEQTDLPFYLLKQKSPPLINLANTAPLMYRNNYVTIHDLAFYHYPEWNSKMFSIWYNILMPRIAYNARHIFTVSEAMKEEMVKYYRVSPGKISITYNGISQKMLDAGFSANVVKEKMILSVGSFNKRKNHHKLIEAFIHSNIKDKYRLVIVGDRNKVFSESGLDEDKIVNENIQICEGFTDAELIDMYQKAEVLVSLSLYEGFGIPLLEGLFFGCKVLCSDIPVYRELYNDHATFCDPLNIENITTALNSIVSVPARGGIGGLLEKFNYKNAAKTILDSIK